mmetsp:Transcript_20012/g.28350  ORF Transcript_20012/g.28350 Transcript_20012/m.28350 type:complete len:100 (-) Transcript_20012:526-825(-)
MPSEASFEIGIFITMSNKEDEKHGKEGWGTSATRRTYRDLRNLDPSCENDLDNADDMIGKQCALGEDSGNGDTWGQLTDLELKAINEGMNSMELDGDSE